MFCQHFETFCSKYKNIEKFQSFRKIPFPRNVHLDTQITFMTSLPKNFRQRLDIFPQKKSENDEKKCNSLKKQSSKRSFEDLRSRYDKPAGKFHRKSEIFAQSLKTIKDSVFCSQEIPQNFHVNT